jgi:hypothetical protein
MKYLKDKGLIIIFFSVVILYGCASHSSYKLTNLDETTNITADYAGIKFYVKPFTDEDALVKYFGNDLVDIGIVPIQIRIKNESESEVAIDCSNIKLIPPDEATIINSISAEEVYSMAKNGYWSTAIWTIAFLDLGFFASAANITEANMRLDSDLQARLFKNGVIQRGRATEGVVFFRIEPDTRSLANWKLSTRVFPKKKDGLDLSISL